jgi:hypothetical protein
VPSVRISGTLKVAIVGKTLEAFHGGLQRVKVVGDGAGHERACSVSK